MENIASCTCFPELMLLSIQVILLGLVRKVRRMISWIGFVPYLIVISCSLQATMNFCMYGAHAVDGLPNDVYYLYCSGVVVGDLLFYGIPMFMQDCIDGQYDKRLTDIPEGVDVLITHSPPFGVLDFSDQEPRRIHYGDTILMQKVLELKPRCHLFGHNHSAYGVDVRCGITFSNAAVLDNNYDLVRAPNLIVV